MMSFNLILHVPAGSLLIGGYTPTPDGMHAAQAHGADGLPLIPATALRGALREALEAVLRGAGEPACAGGDGVDPERESAETAARPCTLDGGQSCKACRLFGTRRAGLERGERASSGLVLTSARLASGDFGWNARPGVSIDRRRRSAKGERLFIQHVLAGRNLRFVARGRLRAPELKKYFEAAVAACKHVGAGRSRGLARVEMMKPEWHVGREEATAELPGDGDVRVRIRLLSPAAIGAPIADENLRETRNEIPGAALRGAVGFALAELLDKPDEDTGFQTLVADDAGGGAHFGFLYPVDGKASSEALWPSGALPITAAACKHEGRLHGLIDTLLDRLALEHVETAAQALKVEETTRSQCRACGAPLRDIDGSRRAEAPPATRAVTRVSMDRRRSAARSEHLFTQILLDEGLELEGTIRNIPAAGRAHLARALSSGILSLGRGRASGWGEAEVRFDPAPPLASLVERGEAFDKALRARLAAAGLPTIRVGRLAPITLLSPLLPGEGEDGEHLLLRVLEGGACFLKARRFSREGGWDQRQGRMEPHIATAAGGVFVIDLQGRGWRDALPVLARLEQQGLGVRRHQGYGQVICFDPFIRQRELTR